jgi:2-keto-3-deoxy-L-rhamnonate aldolase RhmA
MIPNLLRTCLASGESVCGTIIQEFRSPAIAQLMALAGCDFVFFDMEHGPYNLETVADMVRATRLVNLTPLVRVPSDEYHVLVRPLEAGAQGIMVPRVESKDQVERIISQTMYPPLGSRGCSVNKGHNDFAVQPIWEFTEQANRENLIIVQIERVQAVESLADILAVAGLGAILIGPNDLALSMGEHSKDMLKALEPTIQYVLDTALKAGVPCGIHANNLEWLCEWRNRGMQILMYGTDIMFLIQGAKSGMDALKNQLKD